jgi:uncharacterized protein with ATP-grasp and redox domains
MQDSESVITQATKGIVDDIRDELEVKQARIYEILSKDNPYPKAKRLIRAIGRRDKSPDKWRVRLIKADLDAMFNEILGEDVPDIGVAEVHKESSEFVQAVLEKKPKAVILNEARDLSAAANKVIAVLENGEVIH